MPRHTETAVCKNCGHKIYYQFDHWEHYTRVYRMSLETHAITSMMMIDHEIYALAWVLGEIDDLPFRED